MPRDRIHRYTERLQRFRKEHGVRAETLVPDLALMGLLDDAVDATNCALDLLDGPRPYRAYSMVRVSFEAAQRLLVLVAADDYIALGTRAWLYYQAKDSELGDTEKSWDAESVEIQVLKLWEQSNPLAREVMDQERLLLSRLKGPDNFLGRSLAGPVDEAYAKIAARLVNKAAPTFAEVNRGVYAALSRDTHACIRLQPAQFRIDADGFVEVVERPRIREEVEQVVVLGLESALQEVLLAMHYRLVTRRDVNVNAVMAKIETDTKELRADFLPDFGRHIAELGLGSQEMHFVGVPINHIRQLPDETLSFSIGTGPGPDAHLVTFDFKGDARRDLLERLTLVHPQHTFHSDTSAVRDEIDLPEPLLGTLTAVLGTHHKSSADNFVPMIVTEIAWSD